MANPITKYLAKKQLKKLLGGDAGSKALSAFGLDVDSLVEKLSGDNHLEGIKTTSGEYLKSAYDRIDKELSAKTGERIITSLGEYILPEAIESAGEFQGNKYRTLANIMAAMQGGMTDESRARFGVSKADALLSAQRAIAERKASNWEQATKHAAKSVRDTTAFNHKENEKTRQLKTSIDPNLEGRGSVMYNQHMLNKDADAAVGGKK